MLVSIHAHQLSSLNGVNCLNHSIIILDKLIEIFGVKIWLPMVENSKNEKIQSELFHA